MAGIWIKLDTKIHFLLKVLFICRAMPINGRRLDKHGQPNTPIKFFCQYFFTLDKVSENQIVMIPSVAGEHTKNL